MKKYTALEMLFATHVIEGRRDIEDVPASIRETVREIVDEAISKKEQEQQF